MRYAIINTEFFKPNNGLFKVPVGTIVEYEANIHGEWSIRLGDEKWGMYSSYTTDSRNNLIKSFLTFIDKDNKLVKLIFNQD